MFLRLWFKKNVYLFGLWRKRDMAGGELGFVSKKDKIDLCKDLLVARMNGIKLKR